MRGTKYKHLKTRIRAMEREHAKLMQAQNRTPQMMDRLNQIEQLIPYIKTKP